MTVQQKIISNKLGLLNLAEELGNVSKACKIMGFSRDTFYRYKELKEEGGIEALVDKSRRGPNRKNRVDEETERQVLAMSDDNPALGPLRISNELRKKGIFVSSTGVRGVLLRHNLETFQKRLEKLWQQNENGHLRCLKLALGDGRQNQTERQACADEEQGADQKIEGLVAERHTEENVTETQNDHRLQEPDEDVGNDLADHQLHRPDRRVDQHLHVAALALADNGGGGEHDHRHGQDDPD